MRTWLFAPGQEQRKIGKILEALATGQEGAAFQSPDRAIFDWEDAVPPAEKDTARSVTLEQVRNLDPALRRRLVVRVNHPASEWFEGDLAALEGEYLGAVMLPKVEHVHEIEAVVGLDLPILILLESALGIERAFELCSAHEQVRYVSFGPLDLLADLGGEWTVEGEETLYARQRVAIAARAARLDAALDGPYPRLRDLEGLREDTLRARRMGYRGRLVIHPAQVAVVADAYAPSEEDLAFARKVLAEAERAQREGLGAVSVDGRFVDPPVVRWAESVVAGCNKN